MFKNGSHGQQRRRRPVKKAEIENSVRLDFLDVHGAPRAWAREAKRGDDKADGFNVEKVKEVTLGGSSRVDRQTNSARSYIKT